MIRIPTTADKQLRDAFEDVQQALSELEAARLQIQSLEAEVRELREQISGGDTSVLTQHGDTIIEGDLRVEGDVTIRGDVAAPQILDGVAVATPAETGGSSSAQRVVEVHGSLAVLNALSAHTMRAARLDAHPVFWRVRRTADKSIDHSTVTTVDFDTTLTRDVIFTNPSNEGRATIVRGGLYLIGFNVEWAANATNIRSILLYKNATTYMAAHAQEGFAASVNRQTISVIHHLAAGDFVQAQVFQTSGAPLDLNTQDDFAPVFFGIRLGV